MEVFRKSFLHHGIIEVIYRIQKEEQTPESPPMLVSYEVSCFFPWNAIIQSNQTPLNEQYKTG